MTKNSKYQTKIFLENQKRHYTPYYTEYGLLSMTVYTEWIKNKLSKHGGTINVKYHININSSPLSIMDLTIKVEQLNNDNKRG